MEEWTDRPDDATPSATASSTFGKGSGHRTAAALVLAQPMRSLLPAYRTHQAAATLSPSHGRAFVAITAAANAERIHRLEGLVLALAREALVIAKAEDPLLYAERRDYLKQIRSAGYALDEARIVLVAATQRLEQDQQG